MNRAPRDFHSDLRQSESNAVTAVFDAYYARISGVRSVVRNCANNEAQRRGVDVLLHMDNDSIIRIDEKADKHPPNNYFL